jgi:hypothetical protein
VKRPAKAVLVVVGIVALLLVVTVVWLAVAPRSVPAGQPPLVRLGAGELSAFREAFNASPGAVPVLVLLSPT